MTILLDGVPEPGASPVVMGDESVLWSVVEGLLGTAIHHGGQGAAVAFTLAGAGGGLTLEIAGADGGVGSERLAGLLDGEGRLAAYRSGLRANGADLAIASSPGTGFTAVISFPAARCLSPA